MKTKLYLLSALCCMLLFACSSESSEKDAPTSTRTDLEEEINVSTDDTSDICFSCLSREQATAAYNYPVTTGGGPDVIKLNQIPDAILKNMTTKGLVQSLLTFPGIWGWNLSSYTAYGGFLGLIDEITIFPELYSRNDAATCLLDLYKVYDQYACEGGELTLQTFDMILSRPEIYTKLTDQEMTELIEAAINKIENLREVDEEGVIWWFSPMTYLFMGRIMYYVGYAPLVSSMDADEHLTKFLEKPEDFFFNNTDCTPEKFHEFFMTQAKAFVSQR